MLPANGSVFAVLLAAFIGLSLALSGITDERTLPEQGRSVASADAVQTDDRQARFLEPAFFGVKKKKFVRGTRGVGTFFKSWRNCIDEGKSLATIETEEEEMFVNAMIARDETDYWIAATTLGNYEPLSLTWITSDLPVKIIPDDYSIVNNSCISISPSGTWTNQACFDPDVVFPYICEAHY